MCDPESNSITDLCSYLNESVIKNEHVFQISFCHKANIFYMQSHMNARLQKKNMSALTFFQTPENGTIIVLFELNSLKFE